MILRWLMAVVVGLTGMAQAQAPGQNAGGGVGVSAQARGSPVGLPTAPTVKVLAIGRIAPGAMQGGPGAVRAVMPSEVRETVKLYLAGKIDQWYVRQDQNGVVFLMNVSTVAEAHALLDQLPLGVAKMMEFDLIPLGPLTPLTMLLGAPTGAAGAK